MRYVRRSSSAGARLLLVAVLIGGALGPAIADERTINAMGHGVEFVKLGLKPAKTVTLLDMGIGFWAISLA